MSVLFDITHDADNLDEYDSTATDGGKLSTSTPGLVDTAAKMQALIDDTTAKYGQKNQAAPGSNEIRYRFYIDPNGITMGNAEAFVACRLDGGASFHRTYLRYYVATGYQIWSAWYNDGGYEGGSTYNISDAEHYCEIHIKRATSDTDDNGEVYVWVDGNLVSSDTDVDNWDLFAAMAYFRLGACESVDAGTSGTVYLDELKANDDGSEIGPVVPAGWATMI